MSILKKLYPKEYRKSTYSLNFEKYYNEGYRGVLFDIDNTLVPHDAPVDEKAIHLFDNLRKIGFRTCLISNNQEDRVKPFADAVGSEFICNAHKPSRKSYMKAYERMNTTKETTLFVGDQIFTDVYGANRSGMYSILVKPIHPKEEIQIVMKRYLEKIVLHQYKKNKIKLTKEKL